MHWTHNLDPYWHVIPVLHRHSDKEQRKRREAFQQANPNEPAKICAIESYSHKDRDYIDINRLENSAEPSAPP